MNINRNKIIFFSVLLLTISALVVFGLQSNNSPTACSGQWTSCTNAFGNDLSRAIASVTSNSNKTGAWNNYGFSIPNSASINNVIVRTDFFASNVRGYINVRVSGDGGNIFGPSHVVGGNTVEQTYLIDVTNDLGWSGSKLNNTNFRVNVTCFKKSSGSNPTCNLDWAPVNVTYTLFDFSVGVNPSNSIITQPGNSAQTTVTVSLLGGNSQNIVLSQTGCPPSSTCNFNPGSGNPTYISNLTVTTGLATSAGTYNINVTGTGDGKTRSTIYTVNVSDSQPVASASAIPTSGLEPLTVNFTGTVNGGDAPLTFFWDFKDGTNSTEQNPLHTFTTNGTYNVTFKATDFDGDFSVDSEIITVT